MVCRVFMDAIECMRGLMELTLSVNDFLQKMRIFFFYHEISETVKPGLGLSVAPGETGRIYKGLTTIHVSRQWPLAGSCTRRV